jgi:hypothetical protein
MHNLLVILYRTYICARIYARAREEVVQVVHVIDATDEVAQKVVHEVVHEVVHVVDS